MQIKEVLCHVPEHFDKVKIYYIIMFYIFRVFQTHCKTFPNLVIAARVEFLKHYKCIAFHWLAFSIDPYQSIASEGGAAKFWKSFE